MKRRYWLALVTTVACGGNMQKVAAPSSPNKRAEETAAEPQALPYAKSLPSSSGQSPPMPTMPDSKLSVHEPSKKDDSFDIETQKERALSLRTRDCVEACRALQSLERSVTQLCSSSPPKCGDATELAKRTRNQVILSCPVCGAEP